MTVINVQADRTYAVTVGHGAVDQLPGQLHGAQRVALLSTPALRQRSQRLAAAIPGAILIEVPDGEAAKTADVLQFCWHSLGRAGFTRSDLLISLGGGATTDLAGFVAATWLRGIDVIHIPSTLLAMVDAAVGGKTGINTQEGKNLVGAFHSPRAVLCDLDLLSTLPQRDYVAGLAEVVKAGFIRDAHILELIEGDIENARFATWEHAPEVITRAIQVKADVVGTDLREKIGGSGGREILNYGHTLGHAIERVEKYSWRHGDAVSVGMVFAAELAHGAGLIAFDLVARHRNILEGLGLPTRYAGEDWEGLMDAMKLDKKSRGSTLRFIVLKGVGYPDVMANPDTEALLAAFARVGKA